MTPRPGLESVAFERVVACLRPFVSRRVRLTPGTRLYHDLGMSGDDADEFLSALFAMHDVAARGFKFDRYFDNEFNTAGAWIAHRLGWRLTHPAITIGHLSEVIRAGAWFDPA